MNKKVVTGADEAPVAAGEPVTSPEPAVTVSGMFGTPMSDFCIPLRDTLISFRAGHTTFVDAAVRRLMSPATPMVWHPTMSAR